MYQKEKFRNLKICKKCILPETYPFIKFNNEGICNYCLNNSTVIPGLFRQFTVVVRSYNVLSVFTLRMRFQSYQYLEIPRIAVSIPVILWAQ